jgi:hypothetical protein
MKTMEIRNPPATKLTNKKGRINKASYNRKALDKIKIT